MRVTVTVDAPEPVLPAGADGPAGGPWPYVLAHGGQVSFADEAGDLVCLVVDGYDRIPDTDEGHDQALVLRAAALADLGNAVQGAIIEDSVGSGSFELGTQGEDVLTALGQDRRIPFCGLAAGPGVTHEWAQAVPLVVVRTDYVPFTDRPAPSGNVIVLDPSSEVTFLQSLAELGLVRFLTSA